MSQIGIPKLLLKGLSFSALLQEVFLSSFSLTPMQMSEHQHTNQNMFRREAKHIAKHNTVQCLFLFAGR